MITRRLLCYATGWLAAATITLAQTPDSFVSPAGYTVRISADWTYVNACVTDRQSRKIIRNLARDDFLLFEDGRMQPLKDCLVTESPFNLLLLLDTSASTAPSIKLIRAASTHFTRQLKPGDRIAVATFNTTLDLRQRFTEDHDRVREVIERITPTGNTKLYDAMAVTVQQFMEGLPARKAVVLFTDGADNSLVDPRRGSLTTFSELVETVRRSDCVIYPVFLSQGGLVGRDGKLADQAQLQLRQLAAETGGRLYTPKVAGELKKIYEEVAQDLRGMYTLIYRPPVGPQQSWREVIVTVKNRPDMLVRTRRGYVYRGLQEPSPSAAVAPNQSTERSE